MTWLEALQDHTEHLWRRSENKANLSFNDSVKQAYHTDASLLMCHAGFSHLCSHLVLKKNILWEKNDIFI